MSRLYQSISTFANNNRDWLALLLFATILFFIRGWEGDLHGDQIHYAAVSKNILTLDSWLVLHNQADEIYARKPPLMFWLVASSFKVLGYSTFAAKLWPRLFAVGCCLLAYAIGRRLFNRTAGLLAGSLLVMCPEVFSNALELRLDSAVVFFALLAVYAAVRAHQDERPSWLLVCGVAAGLGLITKAVAVVHVTVLVALFLALFRPRWLLNRYLLLAGCVALVIGGPWYLYMIYGIGTPFTSEFFGQEVGTRLVPGVHIINNLGNYALALMLWSLPWWPFGVYALFNWRRWSSPIRRTLVFLVLWVVAVLILMAVAPKAYERYLVPAYPAIMLLSGYGLSLLIPERIAVRLPSYVRRLAIAFALVLALMPVPLHRSRIEAFTVAGKMINLIAPGDRLTVYQPEGTTIPIKFQARIVFLLDRKVVICSKAGDLKGDDAAVFVAARGKGVPQLEAEGYRELFKLEPDDYWLLFKQSSTRMRKLPSSMPAASAASDDASP